MRFLEAEMIEGENVRDELRVRSRALEAGHVISTPSHSGTYDYLKEWGTDDLEARINNVDQQIGLLAYTLFERTPDGDSFSIIRSAENGWKSRVINWPQVGRMLLAAEESLASTTSYILSLHPPNAQKFLSEDILVAANGNFAPVPSQLDSALYKGREEGRQIIEETAIELEKSLSVFQVMSDDVGVNSISVDR